MSKIGKNVIEGLVEAQEKVFLAWKEAVAEYNNTKVMEMFGEDIRNAWDGFLELQGKAFSLWKEAVQIYKPFVEKLTTGDLMQQNYRRWWELQEKMIRSSSETATPRNMWEVFNNYFLAQPERMFNFYREWMEIMQEGFKQTQKKSQSSSQTSKGKEN
ncbi:MAG: hypothetical protein ACOX6X_03410 [Dethiobacteria bacterium]|jgi:hypothetical protein